MKMIKNLILYLIENILLYPLYKEGVLSVAKVQIEEDIERWCKELNIKYSDPRKKFGYLMRTQRSFRNLFYFRVYSCSKKVPIIWRYLFPVYSTLFIDNHSKIDGGLYFWHPFSTIIFARHIGKNCTIRQLTTIGNLGASRDIYCIPEIGDNVDIGANVTIIGDINIGDNVRLGAGSVVVKSIPANCSAGGNPAHVLRSYLKN